MVEQVPLVQADQPPGTRGKRKGGNFSHSCSQAVVFFVVESWMPCLFNFNSYLGMDLYCMVWYFQRHPHHTLHPRTVALGYHTSCCDLGSPLHMLRCKSHLPSHSSHQPPLSLRGEEKKWPIVDSLCDWLLTTRNVAGHRLTVASSFGFQLAVVDCWAWGMTRFSLCLYPNWTHLLLSVSKT